MTALQAFCIETLLSHSHWLGSLEDYQPGTFHSRHTTSLTFLEKVLSKAEQSVVTKLELLLLVDEVLAFLQHALGEGRNVYQPVAVEHFLHSCVDNEEGTSPARAIPAQTTRVVYKTLTSLQC